MTLDSSKVDVGITGAVSFAPVGTTAPTSATSVLPVAFRDVGYISDDGVSINMDKSTNNITAWQGAAVVRTVVTESSITLTFTMIETNANSVELWTGSAVSGTDGSVLIKPELTGGRRAFVLDYVDGTKFVRHYLPQGEVTSVGSVTVASGDPVGYEVTITGYPDATLGSTGKSWFSALDTTP